MLVEIDVSATTSVKLRVLIVVSGTEFLAL